jgi:hypothetical protein
MMRHAAVALAALVLLSGCTLPPEDKPNNAGVRADSDTYTITLTNFNGHSSPMLTQSENFTLPVVQNGTAFRFTEKIEGSAVLQSEHIGGHFGTQASPSPSTTLYNIPCNHVTGVLPQTYEITCTAPSAPGYYHLRGHARITQAGADIDWWSADIMFRVS